MRRTLAGTPVVVQETPGVGVATLDLWVNAGAANELPHVQGVSHFLEHMLFKGTRKRQPGEMDRLVEGMGGILNAGTSKDWTHYHMTTPAKHAPEALEALSDSIQNSVIDAGELEKERGVVLEEINRKEDSPYGYLYEKLYETAYKRGPYRHSVLGDAAIIRAIPREVMLDYYHRHYTPLTMALVVAGDVTAAEIEAGADRAFAGFDRKPEAFRDLDTASEWNAGAVAAIPKDVKEVYAAVAYPAPGIRSARDVIATDVLQTALVSGRASRLYREIKERRQLATTISASYPTHRHESLFAVTATVQPAKFEEYKKAVVEELSRACEKKFSKDELSRAKRLLVNGHLFSKETTSGAASVVGYYLTLTGSLDFEQAYVGMVEAVTAEEAREAARRVFLPDQAVWVWLQPKSPGVADSRI